MLDIVNSTLFNKKNTEENRMIIDVRTPQEYAFGHLEKAVNINFYDSMFIEKISALDKTQPISLYCRSGDRSGQTLQIMASLGFTNVIDLEGGIQLWVQYSNTLCTDC
jgi:rhodanese-related sulfurtransferase